MPKLNMKRVKDFENDEYVVAILHEWERIAPIAWQGYRSEGRGAVCVARVDDALDMRYLPELISADICEDVTTYDPERELVLFVNASMFRRIYVIGSLPTPQQIWAASRGDAYGMTEQ